MFGSGLAPLFAADQRGFKIGACEWSLRKSDPTCFEIAKRIGLDGVQVDIGRAKDDLKLRRPEVQRAYLNAAKESGLEISSLAMAELNNVGLKSEPVAALWVRDAIDVTKALGLRVVLVAQFYKGDLKDDKPGIDRTVAVLKELAPRAVQVYYDVGNSTDKGYDIYKEIRMLKGHICEFHAKDAGYMLGKGRIDFAKVRAAMNDIGYRGWIQIEAAAPSDLVSDYRAHCEFLRGVFPP